MKQIHRKISFPLMGNYYVAIKPFAEMLGGELVPPPPITRKTVDLGFKYSPEAVCVPFKYNLGNYIEVLERGANLLIQAGGGCRFGYYGEVQEAILKNMGYKFTLIKLTNTYNPISLAKIFRSYNSELTYWRFFKTYYLSYFKVKVIDEIEDYIRKNIGFEKNPGQYERLFKIFLSELGRVRTKKDINQLRKKYEELFKEIEVVKPTKPVRVGIVGELYVLMEPFSNFNIEMELAKKGIEVYRFCSVSSILHDIFSFGTHITKLLRLASPYLKYHIGAHGTESVALAHKLIKQGFDGIIHLKPFGCMPEVNAMSALYRLSKDYKVPIIYFSFDAQTSETGIKTRLEAFYDMLIMKRDKLNSNTTKINYATSAH
ncbi:MAG: 2-hydroxyacyl-CoA dehydratase [Patescibacteria group bacterium]